MCRASLARAEERASPGKKDSAQLEDAAAARADRSELTAVPFVGGDSDMGWGGGVIASWARLSASRKPYLYRIEAAAVITAKKGPDGFELPFTDAYLLFETPHAIANRLKLRLRLSYTREARLKYYGVGNASVAQLEPEGRAIYGRVHPTLDLQAEYRVTSALKLLWGANYTQNWLTIAPGSRLSEEIQSGPAQVQQLLGEPADRGTISFSYGVALDTRDDLVSPERGIFTSARVDLSPGGALDMTQRFARFNASLRGFIPLFPRRLVLAARVVGDFLTDGAPFYELGRYDATSAIGGVQGVRGIPAQRYIGRFKTFGNLELRSHLFGARLFNKATRFGLTGFVDGGRVWADYEGNPELDGTGLGMHYGVGGGLRVAAGASFVLRLDVAWSQDANPIAAYLTSGHAF